MNTQYNIAKSGRGKEIFAFCGRFRKVKTNYGWKYQLVMFEVIELDDVYQSENGMVEYIHDRPVKIDRNTYEAYEVRYTEEIVKYRIYKPVK